MTDKDDPFDSQEFLDYADRVRRELIPKLEDSSVVVSLVPDGEGDVKFAVELGFSVMMDKPIIAVVAPGSTPSTKLIKVADVILEADLSSDAGRASLQERLPAAIAGLDPDEPA